MGVRIVQAPEFDPVGPETGYDARVALVPTTAAAAASRHTANATIERGAFEKHLHSLP